VYDLCICDRLKDDLVYAVENVVSDKTDASLVVAKHMIDGLTGRMYEFAESTIEGCHLRTSVLLESVRLFEKIWPRSSLANFVLKVIYEDFAEKMVKREIGQDWGQAIQKYRTVLIVVTRLQIASNRDFIQRMIYRNSLLPMELQNGVKEFFRV
jgi:hypothetical protein